MLLGGTLPVPLYVLYEGQMGFGPLGVMVVFAVYVAGSLFVLLGLGDLSDHIGRRLVELIAARVVSGAGVVTDRPTADVPSCRNDSQPLFARNAVWGR
jgi:hypothetical protein